VTQLHPAPRGGGDPEVLRLLYVGRLSREKGLISLIAAVGDRALKDRVRLDIVGEGPHEDRIRRAARSSGARVEVVGACSDEELSHRYARADIFCMPSTTELESIATLEALSFGVPVVAAESAALAELARRTGAVRLYESRRAPAALQTAILDLAADPRRREEMGLGALREIQRRSLERVGERWTRLYRGLVQPRPAAGLEWAA
jgi:glycosyltransferase involved in cell wall biosynthesis